MRRVVATGAGMKVERATLKGNGKRLKEESLPRWQTTTAWLSLVCAVVALLGLSPLAGSDLWMHMTLGRWI